MRSVKKTDDAIEEMRSVVKDDPAGKERMREKLKNELKTGWAGKTCLSFSTLESTNDYGKLLAKEKRVHGTLILADEQTAGRGRRGRSWQSPKGTSIYMSLCLEPEFPAHEAAGLTLVMALAAATGICEITGVQPQIKWPNDLVVNKKKVCGILTELCMEQDHYVVVIGTGINVNTESFPDEIQQTASSLKLETGKEISRQPLIEAVLKHFEIFYEKYTKTGNLSLLKESYEAILANKNREVCVLDPKGAYTGVAEGITKEGNLIVLCEDGSRKSVSSGEVSVRGLYGYV